MAVITDVYVAGSILHIISGEGIEEVSMNNLQGITVFSVKQVGDYQFRKEMPGLKGIYIVSVKLKNGESKTQKLVISGR